METMTNRFTFISDSREHTYVACVVVGTKTLVCNEINALGYGKYSDKYAL